MESIGPRESQDLAKPLGIAKAKMSIEHHGTAWCSTIIMGVFEF